MYFSPKCCTYWEHDSLSWAALLEQLRTFYLRSSRTQRSPTLDGTVAKCTKQYKLSSSFIGLHRPSSEVNYRPPSVTVTSPDKSQIMKLVQNFMLFLPVPLASLLGEEGVHSCAGTITVTLPGRGSEG